MVGLNKHRFKKFAAEEISVTVEKKSANLDGNQPKNVKVPVNEKSPYENNEIIKTESKRMNKQKQEEQLSKKCDHRVRISDQNSDQTKKANNIASFINNKAQKAQQKNHHRSHSESSYYELKSNENHNNPHQLVLDIFCDDNTIQSSGNSILTRRQKKRQRNRRSNSESSCYDNLKCISTYDSENFAINKTKTDDDEHNDANDNDGTTSNTSFQKQNNTSVAVSGRYRSMSESCVDVPIKGILKRISSGYEISERREFNEVQEENLKKTEKSVRFDNTIKKQLYRANSSILGQRKKNQKKRCQKQRAAQRRNSS